jgi:hypothetical protein
MAIIFAIAHGSSGIVIVIASFAASGSCVDLL